MPAFEALCQRCLIVEPTVPHAELRRAPGAVAWVLCPGNRVGRDCASSVEADAYSA